MRSWRWVRRGVRALLRRRDVETELSDEIRLHLEMEAEELVSQGWSDSHARREALRRLGGLAQTREAVRDTVPFHWLGALSLDSKLGVRMLRKHWALTLFGGVAIAMAVTVAASVFELLYVVRGTALPLEEGDRVVVIQPFDREARQIRSSSLEDFRRWASELSSVEDIGAFRPAQHNLVTADGPMPPVSVAEMTASGFGMARVAPLLGRVLRTEDEAAAAAPVVVIGYEAWQSTFAGDPDVLGQDLRLDGVFYTVVGVMPEGFAFPVNHQYWTPFKPAPGDRVVVFARLAPGVEMGRARAEVETIGLEESGAVRDPAVQARIVPYVQGMTGSSGIGIVALLPLVLPLLLIPPCGNVAILIYARTLSRQGEFAARQVLGAGRARIVGQIFVEILILTSAAAVVALLLTPTAVDLLRASLLIGDVPFWMDFGLSYPTIGYGLALSIVAALIAGVIPALRATGRGNMASLHSLGARSAPRLGRAWTTLVVVQVSLAVALLPTGIKAIWTLSGPSLNGPRFEGQDYVTARLSLDPRSETDPVRFANLRDELVRRLRAEPGVTGLTVAQGLPTQETYVQVEVEDRGDPETFAMNRVDPEFFDLFQTEILAGRGFEAGDLTGPSRAIVIDRSFAQRVWRGENPLGHRIRILRPYAAGTSPVSPDEPGPWLEIVGVVDAFSPEWNIRVFYQPLHRIPQMGPGDVTGSPVLPLSLAVHVDPGASDALPVRLREIAASVATDLRVDPVRTMDAVWEAFWLEDLVAASGVGGLFAGLIAFSTAGIYTLMTFTVVGRRREIGIRCALGAPPLRLVAGIFRNVLVPASIGVALGGVAALLIDYRLSPLMWDSNTRPFPWALPAAEALLMLVAILAAAGPARRALRVDPAESLRSE